jgi:hypothetical protein
VRSRIAVLIIKPLRMLAFWQEIVAASWRGNE